MSAWTIAWLVWIVAFFAIEMPAVFNRIPGDTLSEHFWKWFAVKDEQRTAGVRFRRTLLLAALAWLVAHLIGGGRFV